MPDQPLMHLLQVVVGLLPLLLSPTTASAWILPAARPIPPPTCTTTTLMSTTGTISGSTGGVQLIRGAFGGSLAQAKEDMRSGGLSLEVSKWL